MMVIPVSQHKLIKIRRVNRDRLTKLAFICSFVSCGCNILCSSTNHWLYTSETLKYFVFPNQTIDFDFSSSAAPVYYKNATIGPWLFCWTDPITPLNCSTVYYLTDEEPSDTTTSIQQSVRKAFLFMLVGMGLDFFGTIVAFICYCLKNPYSSLLVSSLLHINSGIANFSCIIVYMSAVSKEVGNKIHAASEMDDPMFYMSYGFSFWSLKTSFLFTEAAALFSIVVYMAKRDERTFNRYKIRSTFTFSKRDDEASNDSRQRSLLSVEPNTRYNRRTGSYTSSDLAIPDLDSMIPKSVSSDHHLKVGLNEPLAILCESLKKLPDVDVENPPRKLTTASRRCAIPISQDLLNMK